MSKTEAFAKGAAGAAAAVAIVLQVVVQWEGVLLRVHKDRLA